MSRRTFSIMKKLERILNFIWEAFLWTLPRHALISALASSTYEGNAVQMFTYGIFWPYSFIFKTIVNLFDTGWVFIGWLTGGILSGAAAMVTNLTTNLQMTLIVIILIWCICKLPRLTKYLKKRYKKSKNKQQK